MGMSIDGAYFAATRGANLNSLISGYINKKQQTIQDLYQQKAAIEEMYKNLSSGLYTTNSSIYQLNSYYNSQILNKNSVATTLQAQIRVAENKVNALNSTHNSFKTTVTSLDDFLAKLKEATNATSTFDYTVSNESVLDLEIKNTAGVKTQRIDYDVKQIATSTKATSNVFNGYNISKDTLVKDLFSGRYDVSKLYSSRNDLDETMTMKQLGVAEGYWEIGNTTLYISENDTLKDIAAQLKLDGYDAGVRNGQFYIDGKNVKAMNIHGQQSNFGEIVGLTISTGDFSINGKSVNIGDTTTIQDLLNTINADSDYGVGAVFENNQLTLIANQTGNVLIEIDKGTSNFTNVAGFTLGGKMITDNLILGTDGSKQMLTGSNSVSSVTENLTAGQFTITKTYNGVSSTATIDLSQPLSTI